MTLDDARQQIVEVGRLLAANGLVAGYAGNLSMRIDSQRVLTTPTGRPKGLLSPSELVLVDVSTGEPLANQAARPSSEVKMHVAIYQANPRVDAIVHAHPKVTSAIALQPQSPNYCITAEGAATLGPIVRIPYLKPGQWPLARACAKGAGYSQVLVLQHHGAVTTGKTLMDAFALMDSLEHVSQIYLVAMQYNHIPSLSKKEVHQLRGTNTLLQWIELQSLQ